MTDRADGVGAIQDLIAGAGVAAILGSVSGLFYVVQMFGFNLRPALLAVLLTAIYVGTNMLAGYLQLRHQRVEIQIRQRITGLVLNLLTGVTKLRVCGAENHAFRVWAGSSRARGGSASPWATSATWPPGDWRRLSGGVVAGDLLRLHVRPGLSRQKPERKH